MFKNNPIILLFLLQQLNELELIRRKMPDVPLMFGMISQDNMNLRKSMDSSHQLVGVLSHIYQQLYSIGYLSDLGSGTPIPLPPGKGSFFCMVMWAVALSLNEKLLFCVPYCMCVSKTTIISQPSGKGHLYCFSLSIGKGSLSVFIFVRCVFFSHGRNLELVYV